MARGQFLVTEPIGSFWLYAFFVAIHALRFILNYCGKDPGVKVPYRRIVPVGWPKVG
jgi:hypothetical protein